MVAGALLALNSVLAATATATCMLDSDAKRVANNFKTLIADYSNDTANAVLYSEFQDYSDSVNELINGGCPNGPVTLGDPTFASLDQFEAGQGDQPPIPFEILNVWHNCNTVTLRWRTSTPGMVQPEQPVTGIIVLETIYSATTDETHLIKTVYSEFNSGAWLADLGVFSPVCNATATKSRRDNSLFAKLPLRML